MNIKLVRVPQCILVPGLCIFMLLGAAPGTHFYAEGANLSAAEERRIDRSFSRETVGKILEYLAAADDFDLVILGDVQAEVDVSFKGISVEESIRKLMRAADLNYLIIFEKEKTSEKIELFRIRKLIVYQKKTGRTSSEDSGSGIRRLPVTEEVRPQEAEPAPEREAEVPDESASGETGAQQPGNREKKFEGDPEEMQKYLDELSKQGRISPQEYKTIMENIQEGGEP